MFPPADFPGCTLQRLADDHPIFTVIKQPWKGRPKLRGASDGSRTFFLLSDEYLGADWQANRTESDGFLLATNLLFYATDMGQLEGKFASILPASPAAKPREKTLGIARARHAGAPGAPRDWDAAAGCWTRLSPYARHASGCGLKESAPVALGKDSLEGVGLLHVTGRGPLRLSAGEQEALKKYVESGGVVLVDPYAGSPEFAASSKAALEAIFGEMKPLEPNDVLAEGQFEGGVDLSAGIGLKLAARQLLRGRGEQPQGQKLLVVRSGRRPAVLWSEFDLVAAAAGIENYRSLGYKPESARKVVGNLLAWLVAIRVD
jgi:hypothetical protein